MISKKDRNLKIFRAKLAGEDTIEIAEQYGVSVSRIRQICDRQRRLHIAHERRANIEEMTKDWRSMPVNFARISARLCNVLRNENFETMGEVADDFTSGNFDKRLPIPNFGREVREELNTWILAHICHPSVEQGLEKLRKLESIQLTESLAKTRSKIVALQLIERRILAKLDAIELTSG